MPPGEMTRFSVFLCAHPRALTVGSQRVPLGCRLPGASRRHRAKIGRRMELSIASASRARLS
jgi:hypothetical protein